MYLFNSVVFVEVVGTTLLFGQSDRKASEARYLESRLFHGTHPVFRRQHETDREYRFFTDSERRDGEDLQAGKGVPYRYSPPCLPNSDACRLHLTISKRASE